MTGRITPERIAHIIERADVDAIKWPGVIRELATEIAALAAELRDVLDATEGDISVSVEIATKDLQADNARLREASGSVFHVSEHRHCKHDGCGEPSTFWLELTEATFDVMGPYDTKEEAEAARAALDAGKAGT